MGVCLCVCVCVCNCSVLFHPMGWRDMRALCTTECWRWWWWRRGGCNRQRRRMLGLLLVARHASGRSCEWAEAVVLTLPSGALVARRCFERVV
jgi:hypothetical protein